MNETKPIASVHAYCDRFLLICQGKHDIYLPVYEKQTAMRQFLSRILSVYMIKLKKSNREALLRRQIDRHRIKTYEINAYAAETVHRKNREEG